MHFHYTTMPVEIERKFLVNIENGQAWKQEAAGVLFRQGYLSVSKERTVRVRVAGDQGFLTIKGATSGIVRTEFEYAIPLADANEMLDTLCLKPLIEKRRYRVLYQQQLWEIDEFLGENLGLVVAEIELVDAQQQIDLPPWIGPEVSDDPRYFNSSLVTHPYRAW